MLTHTDVYQFSNQKQIQLLISQKLSDLSRRSFKDRQTCVGNEEINQVYHVNLPSQDNN